MPVMARPTMSVVLFWETPDMVNQKDLNKD